MFYNLGETNTEELTEDQIKDILDKLYRSGTSGYRTLYILRDLFWRLTKEQRDDMRYRYGSSVIISWPVNAILYFSDEEIDLMLRSVDQRTLSELFYYLTPL